MSNQTPDDFNDDARAPGFFQPLNLRQAQQQDAAEGAPVNLSLGGQTASQTTPNVEVNPDELADSGVNLDRWAEQRQSAYASLDAALERHIQEAIRTVNEFKQQAEADAVRARYGFVAERDNLVAEIGNLQQEQTRLNQQVEGIRRNIQAEEARQAQARSEREEIESELTWLRSQLEEARRSLQATQLEADENAGKGRLFGRRKTAAPKDSPSLFQAYDAPPVYQRPGKNAPAPAPATISAFVPAPAPEPAEMVEETETSGIFGATAYPTSAAAEEVLVEEPPQAFVPAPVQPAPVEEDAGPFPAFAAYVPPPAARADFGDVETPRTLVISPVEPAFAAYVPPSETASTSEVSQTTQPDPAVLSEPVAAAPAPEVVPARSGGIHVITPSTFAYLQELLLGEPPEEPLADVAPTQESVSPSLGERNHITTTGPMRLGGMGNLEQTAGLPRRGSTGPLADRPPRRRHTTGGLALPVQSAETATPGPVINPAMPSEVVAPTPTAPAPRIRRIQPIDESEQQQKVVLRELGLQLGLNDPMTPPALNSMSFAAGYTPPKGSSALADMLDEINANVSAILPPMPDLEAALSSSGKTGKKVVEPPPPISADTNLDDYSIEEEPSIPTLQELLDAGEQELAAINDSPTPPSNPTPFIGKIGSDHPVLFQPGPTITPKPEPLSMLNQETTPGNLARPGAGNAPTGREFRPLNIRPLRTRDREREQEITLPLTLTFPSLTSSTNTQQTYVTITNLQGRYTLPMLERALRGLEGVSQVLVNDFNQQTLLMEVVHRPNLNLATQFITLADLPLRLVNEALNTLVFVLNSP